MLSVQLIQSKSMEHSQDVTKITLSLKNLSENDVIVSNLIELYCELNIVIYIVSWAEYRVSYRIARWVYRYSPRSNRSMQDYLQTDLNTITQPNTWSPLGLCLAEIVIRIFCAKYNLSEFLPSSQTLTNAKQSICFRINCQIIFTKKIPQSVFKPLMT